MLMRGLVRGGPSAGLGSFMVILVLMRAADFGRRRVWPDVADARRNLSGVCRRLGILSFWFCIGSLLPSLVLSLIVMKLLVCAPHPLVWSAAGLPKRRRIV